MATAMRFTATDLAQATDGALHPVPGCEDAFEALYGWPPDP